MEINKAVRKIIKGIDVTNYHETFNKNWHSKIVVVGGISTIAIADAFSDALGIHVSEEAENRHTTKEIWESTISTFLSKFIFALPFIVPLLLFRLSVAIVASLIWGFYC